MKRYDVIWIGTGQATGTVVPRLVNAGKTVAIAAGFGARANSDRLNLPAAGVEVDEKGFIIVNMFTPFVYAKQSYKLFRKAVLAHPTVAELMRWILDDLKPLRA